MLDRAQCWTNELKIQVTVQYCTLSNIATPLYKDAKPAPVWSEIDSTLIGEISYKYKCKFCFMNIKNASADIMDVSKI